MSENRPGLGTGLKQAVERKLDEAGLSQTDYVKAALTWQYNWIGLGAAAAFAVVSGTGLPLVLAAGLELMYLALVPQSSRFRRLVRSWKYAAERKAHQQRINDLFRNLPQPLRERSAELRRVADAIRQNYSQLSFASQVFSGPMEAKLTGLLDGYIRLLYASYTHQEYLKTLDPRKLEREVEQLEKALEKEPPKVREINQRRIEIIRKRIAKLEKIRENSSVISAQCSAIEDVLQLIRDQSVTMRDPQQVSDQLDHLVQDVEQTEQSVREMEEIFAMTAPESGEDLRFPPVSSSTSPTRHRVPN